MVDAKEKEKRSDRPRLPDFSRPPPPWPEPEEEEDESCVYFRKRYEQECVEVEEVDLGPDFVYPSQQAFEKYLREFDFMKHLKHGTLSKFDGTVKGYPAFKKNFFELVYAQRIGYLHKLMALEYMLPDKIKRELFYDLDNSPVHFGMRIKRLEQHFGGRDRQVQHVMEILNQAKSKYSGKRVPYAELLDLARHVDSHLAKTPKIGDGADHVLVPLRELVPNHIKAAYTMEMKRCGSEESGRAFLKYLLDALMAEIRAQETNPKRAEPNGEKTKVQSEKPKVLGKLYKTQGRAKRQGYATSSSEEDSPRTCRKERSDSDSDQPHFVSVNKTRSFEPPKCTCCKKGAHFLHNCYKFVHKYVLPKKRKFAEKDGRCFRCLRGGHLRTSCTGREIECRFCKATDHHYLLCECGKEDTDSDPGVVNVAELINLETEAEQFSLEALGNTVTTKRVTPLQMVLHILNSEGQMVQLNAMPDTGSTHNILEWEALERMGLHGVPCKYTVTGHGGHTTTHEAVCVEVTMCGVDGKSRFPTKFFAYRNPCGRMQPEDWSRLKRGWTHLKKLDIPAPVPSRPIEAILGCVDLRLFEPLKPPAMRGTGEPVAKLTPLGWMVGGRTRPEVEPVGDGENHAHTSTIMVGQGTQEPEEQVRPQKDKMSELKKINEPSFAGVINFHQNCEDECRQKYENLKENMRRVWDLESEAEREKLANTYYPAVRSQTTT